MKKLKFSTLTFRKGQNVTVRKGLKWLGESGLVELCDTEGNQVGRAYITDTKLRRLGTVKAHHLQTEHDPYCRDIFGLYEVLTEVYGHVDAHTQVTFIYFYMDKDSPEVEIE